LIFKTSNWSRKPYPACFWVPFSKTTRCDLHFLKFSNKTTRTQSIKQKSYQYTTRYTTSV